MELRQVEFLIEGYLLPLTMGELRVSEKLLLHQALRRESASWFTPPNPFYTLAYVCVEKSDEANYFPVAASYLEFFLLIYSLVSGQPVTARMGVGTSLDNIDSLGKKKISFPSVEKVHIEEKRIVSPLNKLILNAKDRFLRLLPDRQQIMASYLGLALTYYYHAVRASQRRLEEVIINLMIASEALLIVKDEKIRSSLARRLSSLIGKNEMEKTEISKKTRELYDLRCDIVHGRGKKPSWNDVTLLLSYVKRAIDSALPLRHFEKKELLEKLDIKSQDDI
jgi:hypothetical protein